MIKALWFITCFVISTVGFYVSVRIQRSLYINNAKSHIQPDTIAISFFLYEIISLLSMMLAIVLFLCLNQSDNEIINGINGSGLLFCISLILLSEVSSYIYKFISSKLKLYDLQSERILVFIIACLTYTVILLKINHWLLLCMFVSLVLGKFFWLDSTLKNIPKDVKKLFSTVKEFPVVAIYTFFACIICALLNNYLVCAILLGNLFCPIFILIRKDRKQK